MKTIKKIIARINYLENNGKTVQKLFGDSYWLQEINKAEEEFVNHPDANKTMTVNGNLVLKEGF